MSSQIICEFCNSSFSSKSNLATHKKRTKKCLAIQNNLTTKNLFECEKCNKTFTSKRNLNEHSDKCSYKMDILYRELEKRYEILEQKTQLQLKEKDRKFLFIKKENEDLKNQLKELQEKLANIAEIGAKKNTKTTNTYRVNNNNIVNNLVPYDLDKDKILTIVDEKFNENYLYARENGIANFAVNNLLKDNEGNLKLTCTDTARKIFVYKDTNGNFYKDPNANGFLENYMPAVKKKSYEIISDKDGEEMVELTDCVTSIEPINISNKLAGKLLAKPKK